MAMEMGYKLVLLVGEEAYYGQFGYVSASSHGLLIVGETPARLLVRELVKNALQEVSGNVQLGIYSRPSIIGSGIEYFANF